MTHPQRPSTMQKPDPNRPQSVALGQCQPVSLCALPLMLSFSLHRFLSVMNAIAVRAMTCHWCKIKSRLPERTHLSVPLQHSEGLTSGASFAPRPCHC